MSYESAGHEEVATRTRSVLRVPLDALVTVEEALEAGVTKGVLRGPRFRPVLLGVHVRSDHPDPDGLATRARAALKVAQSAGLVASVTALALMGVQMPGRLTRDDQVHLLVPAPGTYPERPQVKVHWSRSIARVPRTMAPGGIPSCDPIEAWMQTAKVATHEELVELGDQLVRFGDPLTTLDQMRQRVARSPGRRHIRKIRRALEDVRAGTQSRKETWLRMRAKEAGMPEPEVNADVYDDDGTWIARPDLYWKKVKMAGEYDGAYHDDPAQRVKDDARRRRMEAHGITIVTATKADLSDPTRLIAAFRRAWQEACSANQDEPAPRADESPPQTPPPPAPLT